jgi:hypothetical protein
VVPLGTTEPLGTTTGTVELANAATSVMAVSAMSYG